MLFSRKIKLKNDIVTNNIWYHLLIQIVNYYYIWKVTYPYLTRKDNNFQSFDCHKSFVQFSLFTCQDILLPNFILYEILKSLHHINEPSNISDSTWCIVRIWFRFLLTDCPFLSQLIFQSYKKVYNLDEHVSSVYVMYIFCLQGVFACSLFHVLELFEIVEGSLGIILGNIKHNSMYSTLRHTFWEIIVTI